MARTLRRRPDEPGAELLRLRNVGQATRADLVALGVTSKAGLALCEADDLYAKLCALTGVRHDPCVLDTFAAAIHQARTGEALDWWTFTAARKAR